MKKRVGLFSIFSNNRGVVGGFSSDSTTSEVIENSGSGEDIQSTSQDMGTGDQQPQDVSFEYKKDKRWGSMWKNENDLYNSYKNMEKSYQPLKSKVDTVSKMFTQYGISEDKLEDFIKQAKSYEDPENPMVQKLNYLDKWTNNEQYRPEVLEFFDKLEQKELQDKYGANIPRHIIDELEESRKFREGFESEKQKKAEQDEHEKQVSLVETGVKSVEDWADKNDLVFDEEVKNEFLVHCKENDIDPKYMIKEFAFLANEAIKKGLTAKVQSKTVEDISKSKKAGIFVSSPKAKEVKGNSFRDDLSSLLGIK